MAKTLKQILKEDASRSDRAPDVSVDLAIKSHHLEKMAEGLIRDKYFHPDTTPAQPAQRYRRRLTELEQNSKTAIDGYRRRTDNVNNMLHNYYKSKGLNYKIKHHSQAILTPESLRQAAKRVEDGESIRSVADDIGLSHDHLAGKLKTLEVKSTHQRPLHPPEVIDTVKKALTNESGNVLPNLSNAKAREIAAHVAKTHDGYVFPINSIRRIHFGLKEKSNG